MKYKIKYGSLEYNPSITEEIYKDLIACAEMQGFKFNQHWSNGGKTYKHFQKNGYLNFDPRSVKYTYGKAFVVDNNPQTMPTITLDELKSRHVVLTLYPIY